MTKYFVLPVMCLFVVYVLPVFADHNPWEEIPTTESILIDGKEYLLEDGADFSGKLLRRIYVYRRGIPIKNINFSYAQFNSTVFFNTPCFDCDFTGAVMENTHLLGGMSDPPLSHERPGLGQLWSAFAGSIFTDAIIRKSYICGINREQLESTRSFSIHKDLSKCTFSYCDFSNVDFTGFDLRSTTFDNVKIKGIILTDARIAGAKFSRINVHGQYYQTDTDIMIEQLLTTKDFKEGFVRDLVFGSAIWPEVTVDFSNMVFIDCKFGEMPWKWNLPRPDYEMINEMRKDSRKSRFAKINLTNSVISGCDFSGFLGLTLENVQSTWNYKHGRMEGIKLPPDIQHNQHYNPPKQKKGIK